MRELRDIGVDILTLGQYLRPSPKHLPVARFVDARRVRGAQGRGAGARHSPTSSPGPMVRSSYHADGQRDIVLELRRKQAARLRQG